ncbi:MAG: hypothetical protein DI555_07850 [Novosphingobium pentaromativorans]|uniref:Uncharacterized protein n=1 Tax=Novosphingobium pentaromativorans TaxID=205844 RepID=A0A2W5NPB8_9SPHN|nr:MAG: hypothetical protein DI555_07850 [Novosphingobium pentaromativorans]
MPAGIEMNTPDGRVQLLTSQIYFRLEQKIEIPAGSTGWQQFSNNSGQRDVFVAGLSPSDIPMLAIASPSFTWADVVSTANGGITWRIYATSTGSNPITLYVFSQRRPPVSEHMAGAELYAPDGSIVWSSDYPIARPLGILSNPAPGTYSGVGLSGRSVAHVPQKQEVNSAISFTSAGEGSCRIGPYNGWQVYRRDQWSRTGVSAWGSLVSGSGTAFFQDSGSFQYMCASSPSSIPLSQQISTVGWRSLILDVTNI